MDSGEAGMLYILSLPLTGLRTTVQKIRLKIKYNISFEQIEIFSK